MSANKTVSLFFNSKHMFPGTSALFRLSSVKVDYSPGKFWTFQKAAEQGCQEFKQRLQSNLEKTIKNSLQFGLKINLIKYYKFINIFLCLYILSISIKAL